MGLQRDGYMARISYDGESPQSLIQTHTKVPNIGYIWIVGINFGKLATEICPWHEK